MQFGVRIPDVLVQEVDKFVDGNIFRSRAHLVTTMVVEWIAKQYFPEIPPEGITPEQLIFQAIKRSQYAHELYRVATEEPMDEEEREGILNTLRNQPKVARSENEERLLMMQAHDAIGRQPSQQTQFEKVALEMYTDLKVEFSKLSKEVKSLKRAQKTLKTKGAKG